MNKLELDTNQGDHDRSREKYQISKDISLRLLKDNEMRTKLDDGETTIYIEMFKFGFRMPIQPYFIEILG